MPLLGCLADDYTGATDLASMLVRNGMRTVQVLGAPGAHDPAPQADAVVVALKSRTAPKEQAIRESLDSLEWLRGIGCRQFFFKYCSTFDSTDAGNIGPVAEALGRALDAGVIPVCPAFPANGRTVYQGHLFVGDRLLNESGMQNHPLTPMRDADLVRLLGRQVLGRVALLPYAVVEQGALAVATALAENQHQGNRFVVLDALNDAHLRAIGAAVRNLSLVTGGSGVAMGLPRNFQEQGLLLEYANPGALPDVPGGAVILSGSCSTATLTQIEAARSLLPVLELDPLATPEAGALADQALAWAEGRLSERPIVIAASAPPQRVAAVQEALGVAQAGALVETALAEIAARLVAKGMRRLVVAGGETSGAVVARLGARTLRIGQEIDPGVPWTYTADVAGGLQLALKSGNFGAPDFFLKAFTV